MIDKIHDIVVEGDCWRCIHTATKYLESGSAYQKVYCAMGGTCIDSLTKLLEELMMFYAGNVNGETNHYWGCEVSNKKLFCFKFLYPRNWNIYIYCYKRHINKINLSCH